MRTEYASRHEAMVDRAKAAVAQMVSPRPLAKMRRSELTETWRVLMDAVIAVAALEDKAPAPRAGHLVLAAQDGELTDVGKLIVEQREAARERRRTRRLAKVAGGAA